MSDQDAVAVGERDCGDNSCRYATKRGGMRTNGGCTCDDCPECGKGLGGASKKHRGGCSLAPQPALEPTDMGAAIAAADARAEASLDEDLAEQHRNRRYVRTDAEPAPEPTRGPVGEDRDECPGNCEDCSEAEHCDDCGLPMNGDSVSTGDICWDCRRDLEEKLAARDAEVAALKVALDEAAELIGSRRRAWGPGEANEWLTRYAALKGTR